MFSTDITENVKQVRFFDSLFKNSAIGKIVILQIEKDGEYKHPIIKYNKRIGIELNYEIEEMDLLEIHDLVDPKIREMHRSMLVNWFIAPKTQSLTSRDGDFLLYGKDGITEKVKVTIRPERIFSDVANMINFSGHQTYVTLGIAEVFFEKDFNRKSLTP